MAQEVVQQTEEKMKKSVAALRKELSSLRTGRATPALLDRITVNYYGTPTPINQVASISVPEPRLLTVQPWDKGILSDVEKAIQKSDLGLNPMNDGSVIRIAIPPMTEERRNELVKVTRKLGEEAKIAVRNLRRDANESVKKAEKAGEMTEDESRHLQEKIQKLTDQYVQEVEQVVHEKEQEIMAI